MADLTPYVPRFLLGWEQRFGDTRHQAIEGSLVFADVSGFTRLSERLARAGGKVGAEQMTDVINALFGDLLMVAARRGGEMLKYGGDALLLLFLGDHHAAQAAAACHEMQSRLREIGRVETGAGPVRLRMSVGVHSGTFDMFRVGGPHTELVIAGPAASMTCAMEAAADAGEVLLSAATAQLLPPGVLGAPKADGRLLRRCPAVPVVATDPVPPQPHAPQFLSSNVAAHLSQGAVEPDHRLATVAFLHLMGIDTRLRAGEHPVAVAAALQDTLCVIQGSLQDLGVTLLATDVIADGTKVMASSGAPMAVESAEERMVRALVRIRDADTPLPVRAGAHSGHVFAGDVGPSFRRTFTTIGDVTNTAARVMGQARAGQVLVLRSVLDAVARCDADPQPAFIAKGKSEPLVPFLVRALDEGSYGEDRTSASAPRPLIGRDRPLHVLVAARTGAESGAGTMVDIVGDVGMGKTRLVQELASQLDPTWRVMTLRAEPYHQQTPFFAARHLVARLLGIDPKGCDAARLEGALVDVGAAHLLPTLPLLGDVVGVDVEDTSETRPLDGRFRRERTARAVEDLLGLDCSPTLLIVEDVHWLDDASSAVVKRLCVTAPGHPWLIACTRRPSGKPLQDVEPLELGPIDDRSVRTLIDALTGSNDPLRPDVVDAVVARAAGNPLFVHELVRTNPSSIDTAALPESLEALIATQVDALPHDGKWAIRRAAILGTSFDPAEVPLLDRAAGVSGADVARLLADVVEPEGGGRLRFRHALVRDVVYEALPYRERKALHRQAARLIERRLDRTSDRGVLSLHCFLSDEFAKASQYARQAADQAAEKFANVEAVALYERCLAAADRGRGLTPKQRALVCERLGNAANLASMTDRASKAYRQARRLTEDSDPVVFARLCRKEARLAERAGSPTAATRWIKRGLQALEGSTDRGAVSQRASLWAMYAWERYSSGRNQAAVEWAERAVTEAKRARMDRVVASAYAILDGAYLALGRTGDHAERVLRIYERIDAKADEAVTLVNLGAHTYHRGRWSQALRLYEQGRDGNARTGNLLDAGFGTLNIAEILVDQGHLDGAEEQLQEVERLWRSIGFGFGPPFIDWQRGRLLVRAGEVEEGLELLDRARARFTAAGLTSHTAAVELALAEGWLRVGRVGDATDLLDACLERDATLGGTALRSGFLRLRSFASASSGDIEDAWAQLDESLHRARVRGEVYDVALALEGFAALAALGERAWSDDGERSRLLSELGVVAACAPPLAALTTSPA